MFQKKKNQKINVLAKDKKHVIKISCSTFLKTIRTKPEFSNYDPIKSKSKYIFTATQRSTSGHREQNNPRKQTSSSFTGYLNTTATPPSLNP